MNECEELSLKLKQLPILKVVKMRKLFRIPSLQYLHTNFKSFTELELSPILCPSVFQTGKVVSCLVFASLLKNWGYTLYLPRNGER